MVMEFDSINRAMAAAQDLANDDSEGQRRTRYLVQNKNKVRVYARAPKNKRVMATVSPNINVEM